MDNREATKVANLHHEKPGSLRRFNLTQFGFGRYISYTTPRHRAGWAAYMAARSVSSP